MPTKTTKPKPKTTTKPKPTALRGRPPAFKFKLKTKILLCLFVDPVRRPVRVDGESALWWPGGTVMAGVLLTKDYGASVIGFMAAERLDFDPSNAFNERDLLEVVASWGDVYGAQGWWFRTVDQSGRTENFIPR